MAFHLLQYFLLCSLHSFDTLQCRTLLKSPVLWTPRVWTPVWVYRAACVMNFLHLVFGNHIKWVSAECLWRQIPWTNYFRIANAQTRWNAISFLHKTMNCSYDAWWHAACNVFRQVLLAKLSTDRMRFSISMQFIYFILTEAQDGIVLAIRSIWD